MFQIKLFMPPIQDSHDKNWPFILCLYSSSLHWESWQQFLNAVLIQIVNNRDLAQGNRKNFHGGNHNIFGCRRQYFCRARNTAFCVHTKISNQIEIIF